MMAAATILAAALAVVALALFVLKPMRSRATTQEARVLQPAE